MSELIREAAMAQTPVKRSRTASRASSTAIAKKGGCLRIEGTLIVEKQSHKAIVIGSQGETIKKLSTEAREQIEAFLQRKIYLRLVG